MKTTTYVIILIALVILIFACNKNVTVKIIEEHDPVVKIIEERDSMRVIKTDSLKKELGQQQK